MEGLCIKHGCLMQKKVTQGILPVPLTRSVARIWGGIYARPKHLSMDKPLEQIQWIDVVFYDTLGRPNDESYVLIGLEEQFATSDGDYSVDTLRARSYIRDFASIQVQRFHSAYKCSGKK